MSAGRWPAVLIVAVAALVIVGAVLIGRWSASAEASPAPQPAPQSSQDAQDAQLRVGTICLLARPC